ncbi:MAG: kynureninase [Phycisphaerales bacterium]|nr:MAG: kynureninase [Phycisphaerales bacterium]
MSPPQFRPDEAYAAELDAADPLASCRDRFHLPTRADGTPVTYLCGHSLGLQPKSVRAMLEQELDDWARLGVDAHFEGTRPWYSYHEMFREIGARLVGAKPGEVVMMNSLTVNLHLMMVSFYRPEGSRRRILMESTAFPSDTYAIKTQITFHGGDANADLLITRPREGEHLIRTEDTLDLIDRHRDEIALVLLSGVHYFTGQLFDIERITAHARSAGCRVGWDLAHAAGNVPLRLHDWGPDFACWCSYKYLNAGPGAVAGCFVHERHAKDATLPRFGGWWGNDPDTRFRMHLEPDFIPRPGADGWQISNPPILAMAPVKASLDIFDEVGMEALRAKSLKLTGYLEYLIEQSGRGVFELISPRDVSARGCQLSVRMVDRPQDPWAALSGAGIVCDFRPPDVVRVAPVPLYNTFQDVWRFAAVLRELKP